MRKDSGLGPVKRFQVLFTPGSPSGLPLVLAAMRLRRWPAAETDGSPEPEPAGVDAPLDVRGLGLGFDPLLLDWHIRSHTLFAFAGRWLHATGPYNSRGGQSTDTGKYKNACEHRR